MPTRSKAQISGPKLTRRGVLVTLSAAGGARMLPNLVKSQPSRRILTLVYDKAAGAMRAVERVVH